MKQKKLLVIDGQGGRMGAALVSQCKAAGLGVQIIAVGANSAATAAITAFSVAPTLGNSSKISVPLRPAVQASSS